MLAPPQPQPLPTDEVSPLLAQFRFDAALFGTVIGGRSAIDLPRARVGSFDEADDFLRSYGFDLAVPIHRAAVERIRADAIGFLRGQLLAGLDLDVPAVFERLDPRDMLLLASREPSNADVALAREAAWACAILRVMHTFAHAENHFQQAYYPEIRAAILDRFFDQVERLDDGSQVLRGRTCDVPLLRFEVKEVKPIRSVVLKLLQKEENVAADLFDHIGVRVVVDRPIDALFAVRALIERHTVVFPNIKPTRSRNTLVDTDVFASLVDGMIEACSVGAIDESEALEKLHSFVTRPDAQAQADWNQHSSGSYRSIQFTCRQMIRLANPLYRRLEEAAQVARDHLHGAALEAMLTSLDTLGIDREIQFFFPYEVQLMDRAASEAASVGRASYQEYKSRQIETVQRRVLGRVLELYGLTRRRPRRSATRVTQELPTLAELLQQAGVPPRGSEPTGAG